MRNPRLPVSLNEATCTITDRVSTTNTPHTMKRTISWRTITATTPSAAPSASAPTSPMKTTAEEGEARQPAAHHHGRQDRQAVEAVGEVDRVAGTDDDEVGERDEGHRRQAQGGVLEEGNDELGVRGQRGGGPQVGRERGAGQPLPEHFPARRQGG